MSQRAISPRQSVEETKAIVVATLAAALIRNGDFLSAESAVRKYKEVHEEFTKLMNEE